MIAGCHIWRRCRGTIRTIPSRTISVPRRPTRPCWPLHRSSPMTMPTRRYPMRWVWAGSKGSVRICIVMESPEGGEQREIIIQAILVDSVLSFGRIAFGFPSLFFLPAYAYSIAAHVLTASLFCIWTCRYVCLPYNCKHVFVTITATTMRTETNNTPSDSQVEGIC